MNVIDLIICEDVNTTHGPNGQSSNTLLNPMGSIVMRTVPSQFSFSVFLILNEINSEPYQIRMKNKETGEEYFSAVGQLDASAVIMPPTLPKEAFIINTVGRVNNVYFDREGTYLIEVTQGDYKYEKAIDVFGLEKK